MARKNIWTHTSVSQTIPSGRATQTLHQVPVELKPDAINKERFPAFAMSPEEASLQALMTGSLANMFYATAKENIEMFIDMFNAVEPAILAKQIVYAREKGFTRTIPVAATVVLSKRDPVLFKKVIHRVTRTPHDWKQFIDICRSKKIRNGLGRTIKREINYDVRTMKAYHVIKYPSDVYDMINIARTNATLNPLVIDYAKGLKNRHDENDKHSKKWSSNLFDRYSLAALLEHLSFVDTKKNELLAAAKAVQNKELADAQIAQYIKKYRLPYEFIVGAVPEVTPKIWEALLYSAPYRNLINNLNNFGRNKVYTNPDNLKYTIESIMNPDKVKNSMIFPFRYYTAWNMVGKKTIKVKDEFKIIYEPYIGMDEIRNALQKALEISVDNVPNITDRVCIAPDISGSMSTAVVQNEDKSKLSCINLVGLFTGIILKKCKNTARSVSLLPFDDDVDLNLAKRVMSRETIFDMAKEFHSNGGTSLSAPIAYLRRNNTVVDRIIAFTDSEEWVGSSFIDEFYLYKTQVSPECKAYLVKLVPSRTNAAPPNIKDINFVYGWTENVLRYVTGDLEEQMEEVNKIEL